VKDDDCTFCGFGLYHPVAAKLSVTHLGLYSDARFPGRAILMFHTHIEDMAKLGAQDMLLFWQDATKVGEAIKRVTGSPRINYAVLGNAEPHLHIHLVPRFPDKEDAPTRSPWSDSRPPVELDDRRLRDLTQRLEAILNA